jgi:hypothetical protein
MPSSLSRLRGRVGVGASPPALGLGGPPTRLRRATLPRKREREEGDQASAIR